MKYELIKEYPGSPKLGYITPEREDDKSTDYYNKYSEFWKPIVEKEYEILKIRSITDTFAYSGYDLPKDTIVDYKFENDYHRWLRPKGTYDTYGTGSQGLRQMLTHFEIYSVKRLSDGEIFTIGDFVKYTGRRNWDNSKIRELKIDDKELAIVIQQSGSIGHYYCLNMLEKAKQPLFTTEDGVDLYMNDEFYYFNYLQERVFRANIYSNTTVKEGMKFFSTEQKAIDYIIENKPCLSLKDIEKALIDGCDRNPSKTNGSKTLNLLKELIKNKTKL